MPKYRGGPYSFRDSMVAARVDSIVGSNVTIRVKSMYWPVTMTVVGESVTQEFTSETPVVVDFTAAGAGTYTLNFSDSGGEGPDTGTDTITGVVIA